MRIFHVIPYFPPAKRFGGVPEAVFSLVRAQAKQGHEVFVLTTDAGLNEEIQREGLSFEWLHSDTLRAIGRIGGVHIFYIPNRYAQLANKRKIFSAPFWNKDIEIRMSKGADVLHLHEVHIPGYRKVFSEFIKRGAKTFLSCHGSLDPPVHRGMRRVVHKIADPYMRRGWFRKITGYFALCENEKKQLNRFGVPDHKINILPHGCPSFKTPYEKLRVNISENDEFPTFLYLGRINQAKGVITAVKAFCGLLKQGYRARLICCGPDEGAVEDIQNMCNRFRISIACGIVLAQPGVYVIPAVSHQAIPNLFSKADCTLCPSPYESFGLVPVESLMCGAPVIATESYGCLEHLSSRNSMLDIIPSNDVQSLQREMQNYRVRKKDDINSSVMDIKLPTWDEVTTQTCDYYKKCLSA